MHAWVVTSYPEVVNVLMTCLADRNVSPAYLDQLGLSFMMPFAELMPQQIMFNDGASHTRLRGLCMAAFTPRSVERLRTVIDSTADELLDRVMAVGEMELIAEFAGPPPAMGVPVEDHQRLHAWVLDLAEVLDNFRHDPDRMARIVQSLQQLKAYVSAPDRAAA
jgi:cytochrome P450